MKKAGFENASSLFSPSQVSAYPPLYKARAVKDERHASVSYQSTFILHIKAQVLTACGKHACHWNAPLGRMPCSSVSVQKYIVPTT